MTRQRCRWRSPAPSTQNGTATCTAGAWTYTVRAPRSSANGTYNVTATQTDTADEHRHQRRPGDHDRHRPPRSSRSRRSTAPPAPSRSPRTRRSRPLGGTCGTAAGDNTTVSVAITGASTQNGTATCTAGAWTFTPATALSVDGTYSVTATQTDTASNIGTQRRAVDHGRQDGPGRHAHDGERHGPHVPVHQQRHGHHRRRRLRQRRSATARRSVTVTGPVNQSGTATCSAGSWTGRRGPRGRPARLRHRCAGGRRGRVVRRGRAARRVLRRRPHER